MAGRPRHEALRGHVTALLHEGFGAPYEQIAHEVYLLDNSGRIDTLYPAPVSRRGRSGSAPIVQGGLAPAVEEAMRATHLASPSQRRLPSNLPRGVKEHEIEKQDVPG